MTLSAGYRISRRGITELARDLFGVTLCTGSVDAVCQRASDALAGPHCQLQDWVLDQGAVHVDETGWRTSGGECHKVCVRQERMESHAFNTREEDLI